MSQSPLRLCLPLLFCVLLASAILIGCWTTAGSSTTTAAGSAATAGPGAGPGRAASPQPGSWRGPISLAVGGGQVLVAELDSRTLAVMDAATGAVGKRVALPGSPQGVCAAPGIPGIPGGSALVACGDLDGVLSVVDLAQGQVTATIPIGHTPMSPVLDPDGKRAWVCVRFENAVAAVDLATRKVTARVEVGREPIACAPTPDGKLLVVAHHLPAQAATSPSVAATVALVDTAANKVAATIDLPNGSTSVRGVCVSADGSMAYVSHVLARYQYPTTQLDRGWMNTNAVSIIDLGKRTLLNTVLLDATTQGSANPWGIACSGDGHWLAVACAGAHEAVVIDRPALHLRLEAAAAGKKPTRASPDAASVKNDLEFLSGLCRKIALPGQGPRGLALDGATLWTTLYFSDALAKLDLGQDHPTAQALPLGPPPVETLARTGERLFSDAGVCYQHWQSCATCHPDTRADALNWDLLNDGLGNPENTRSLVLAPQTPPVMSLAIRDSAATAVRTGFRYILFHQVTDQEANAVYAYLQSLSPGPSPHRPGAEVLARGQKVFTQAGCAHCHKGPYLTDLKLYDVGTGPDPTTGVVTFDTPTLLEIWRTAPYLHDGRAATLKEVFTTFNPKDKHGKTSALSPEDLDALVQYVLALSPAGAEAAGGKP